MALIDNLVSYWKLDESSGNASDSHGSNTLTNNNSTAYVSAKINNGADFERGSSNFFEITDGSQSGLDLTDMTISAWFNLESLPSSGQAYSIVAKMGHGGTNAYELCYCNEGGTLRFQFYTESGLGGAAFKYDTTLSTSTWYHVVLTLSGTTAQYYLGGSSVSGTGSSYVPRNGTAPFRIGSGNLMEAADYFDGIVDEVGIWSRAVSSGEVTSLYNSGSGLAYPFSTTSISPSISPSVSPSTSISPSVSPSLSHSISPSRSPSISPSISPSTSTSISPSPSPVSSTSPSISPSISASISPSISSSVSPSISPSISPSLSASASISPSASPSQSPSASVSPSPSPGDWDNEVKHSSSWVNGTRNTSAFSNGNKSSSTWYNVNKN